MDIEDKLQAHRMGEMMAEAAEVARRRLKERKKKADETKVGRTWKLTKTEEAAWKEVKALREEIVEKYMKPTMKLFAKLQTKRSKFWTIVEERLDEYDLKLRIDDKKKVIMEVGKLGQVVEDDEVGDDDEDGDDDEGEDEALKMMKKMARNL